MGDIETKRRAITSADLIAAAIRVRQANRQAALLRQQTEKLERETQLHQKYGETLGSLLIQIEDARDPEQRNTLMTELDLAIAKALGDPDSQVRLYAIKALRWSICSNIDTVVPIDHSNAVFR